MLQLLYGVCVCFIMCCRPTCHERYHYLLSI